MLLSACNNSQSTLVIVRNFQNEGRREYQRVCVCEREREKERVEDLLPVKLKLKYSRSMNS